MPHSAPALGAGLRLRSRRVRSDRSQLSTARLALIAALLAALAGFLGSMVRDDWLPWFGSSLASASADEVAAVTDDPLALDVLPRAAVVPVPPPLALDEERYADALWSINTRVEQTIARVGLGAAFYRSQEIDRGELRVRLTQGLARYRLAELEVQALQPPPTLRATHDGYLAAVRLFQLSAQEMLRMFDDGDDEHLSAAVPLSMDGTTKLREIGGQFWPESYPTS